MNSRDYDVDKYKNINKPEVFWPPVFHDFFKIYGEIVSPVGKVVYLALWKHWNRFVRDCDLDSEFYCSDKQLSSYVGCSTKTIAHYRKQLAQLGLIQYKKEENNSHKATEYRMIYPLPSPEKKPENTHDMSSENDDDYVI